MDTVTLELVRTALLAVILGTLVAGRRLRLEIAGRGWRMLFRGFFILFVASAIEVADNLHPFAFLRAWTGETTNGMLLLSGFVVGFGLVSVELVRGLANAIVTSRTQKLTLALNKVKADLLSGQALLRGVLKGSLSGVVVVRAVRDSAGVVVDLVCDLMNGAAAQILGRTSEELIGQLLLRQIPAISTEGLFRECVSVIESGLPFNEERRYAFGGGAEWLHTVVVKLGDGAAITFTNISARKQAEEQLRHAALHDALTGLPNRAMFLARLEQALHWAQRHPSYRFAVLFFDFDRFKAVNDNLGHEAGDELLISIAGRLRGILGFGAVNPTQFNTGHLPARLGGDEFVVLLDDIGEAGAAVRTAEQFKLECARPHQIAGHEVVSTASIGVVVCDGTYGRCDDILRDADAAMYEAKRAGRSCHVLFDPRVHRNIVQQPRERAA